MKNNTVENIYTSSGERMKLKQTCQEHVKYMLTVDMNEAKEK